MITNDGEKLYLVENDNLVKFYENEEGEQYQQLVDFDDEIYKVANGKMQYLHIRDIDSDDNLEIKYNLNGIFGYSIWANGKCLEDDFWSYDEVLKVANTFS